MRLVINAVQLKARSSGIGVLTNELFSRLAEISRREVTVLLSGDSPAFPVQNRHTRVVRLPFEKDQALRRNLYQSLRMGITYGRDSLFLTTDAKIPFLLPQSCRVVPVITDLAVFRMGEVYQASRTWFWRLQYRLLTRHAARYAAISPFTRDEMVRLLGIAPERIDVVPCAARPDLCRVEGEAELARVREKYGLPRRFFLFVGSFNPRKNLRRLLLAFDMLKKRRPEQEVKLVIAGERGWKFDTSAVLDGISCKQDVLFTGFAAPEDMAALYTLAQAFLFPTLYEGFGIPVIEAQQCGTPVLCSNSSALPETAGEGALLVDALDVRALAEGMERLLTEPGLCGALRERGYKNAARFSWEKSAAALEAILDGIDPL